MQDDSKHQITSIKVNIPQQKFLSLPHKFRAFVGGYGSAKSWAGTIAIMLHSCKHPKVEAGYFAPTYSQIRDIFYPCIEEVSEKFGMRVDIREGNKEVHIYSGQQYRNTVICRSLDRPETIIGFKIGHAMIDELDVLRTDKAQTAWRKIQARMRYMATDLRNGIDVTTTPEGFKFTYQLFVKALQDKPSLCDSYGIVQASTYDNAANLPEDYIPSLIESYPAELIDAYLHGKFVNLTSGTVYRSYNREKHRSSETIQKGEPLYIGMDFNVEHMAAAIYVKRGEVWHIVDELKEVFDTPDMIRLIQDRYQSGDDKHSITIYPDASGRNRKSVNAAESDIALLRQARLHVKVNASNPAVKDRIMATNKAFEDMKIMVNDSICKTVASCLEQQNYNPNGEPDKSSGFDHMNDATSYLIAQEMPIRQRSYHFKR